MANFTHHVMILVHGIMGNHRELLYVQEALQRDFDAAVHQADQWHDGSQQRTPTLWVHSAICNEADSLDGIEAGGLRLAQEINDLLREYVHNEIEPLMMMQEREHVEAETNDSTSTSVKELQPQPQHTIALSFLGFSLGGMYSRYSLPFIDWTVNTENNSSTIPVVPNLFVTAATPHLGIQRMTYWKLPAFLEPLVAWYLGQTGRDLFRRPRKEQRLQPEDMDTTATTSSYDDVVQQMSLDPIFLLPLSRFQKRVAIANAFSTDFAVHTATAAFLTDDDDIDHDLEQGHSSAHFVVENEDTLTTNDNSELKETDDDDIPQYPSVRFTTSRSFSLDGSSLSLQHQPSCDATSVGEDEPPRAIQDSEYCQRPLLTSNRGRTMSDMAKSLNSLGWTKVFVDVRSHIPALWFRPKSAVKEIVVTEQDEGDAVPKKRRVFSPSTLKNKLSGKGFDFNTLPFGHSFLVASTKNWWYTWFYRDGRKFVDHVIAKDLVEELLLFQTR
jgi:Putative serine esterase (DUF676)